MSLTVLATGGAGYIGSHVVAELIGNGTRVVILDDFSNSSPAVVDTIRALGAGTVELVEGDVRDRGGLDALFDRFSIDAVIHLAGLKAVGESTAKPLLYYAVNVGGAVTLFEAMLRHDVRRLVFSSSATVYGTPASNPIPEDAPLGALNPYGRTKLMIEQVIDDLVAAEPDFAAISLRYFNPVGAHRSALIGENPRGVPNNLFPFIAQTAAGLRDKVRIFGDDYPTPDGTGIRDYIHVVDLARGHLAALELLLSDAGAQRTQPRDQPRLRSRLQRARMPGCLFAGVRSRGSLRDRRSPPRRRAECVADPRRAAALLGWRADRGLDEMCRDHWAFQSRLAMPG